uniref:Kinesin motor domain-containing protein n=1 Tax=Oreochromis aureus TaxID=47969 RepID=A0AAZ1WWY8_OREAU
ELHDWDQIKQSEAAHKLSLSRRKKSPPGSASPPGQSPGPLLYTGGFSGALQLSPPAIPPCLLRAGSKVKDTPGMGKVRVMVRICSVQGESSESMSFLKVDGRKKQLMLCETSAQRRSSASAPKTFTFDAIFSQDASQVSSPAAGTLPYLLPGISVGNVTAGSFKYLKVEGKSLVFSPSSVEPETLTDLLAELAAIGIPGGTEPPFQPLTSYLREDPICGSQLQNQMELRASSAERAASFLDAALAARKSSRMPNDQEVRRNSHFLFTLHLYQERLDKSNKATMSGRSRLHLLDLGSCETDISRTREGGGGQCLSLSALGNVILALANEAKHVPYRDSKLTMLLRESLGNINCRTTMIAHISDSPAGYMETLTTVQLASRIHRLRKKKSKHTSSSSGGESSCEEGPSCRPPRLRPFHPLTVALDPDVPLLLSSDPDYSSSSEHSCDTVIYVGPGGKAISDRELSDNEGPPSFVPIIPSLNKKRVKDAPKSDGDHFKCNTFAELQERLDCIDGSEGPAMFGTENKSVALKAQSGPLKPIEATSPPKSEKNSSHRFSESTLTTYTDKPDQDQPKLPSAGGFMETSKRTSADGEKLSGTPVQPCVVKSGGAPTHDSEPVVREKVYLRGAVPKPLASPSLPRTTRTAPRPGEALSRTPPVGMSQQGMRQDQPPKSESPNPNTDGATHTSRTTITLQQPVELNGEDELVFTVIEELPHSLVSDNGRPSNLLSFNTNCFPQALAAGSRPVSIISSINDEYDAYTSLQEAVGPGTDVGTEHQQGLLSQRDKKQPSVGSWLCESAEGDGLHSQSRLYLRDKTMDNAALLSSPSIFHKQSFLQHGIKSSLNDSGVCFSELESNPATPNKPSFTKCPPSPETAKASLKGSLKVKANTLNTSVSAQIPRHATHSSLPRKTKPTSSSAVGCSRQEGRQDDVLLQRSSYCDPREAEFLSAGKPTRSGMTNVSSKRSGGNSNSVPRPPKTQMSSSAQRVVDGCEKSSSRRGDTLIKLPRLTRGATTLGTISTPQEAASVISTLRFSSLGKKANGQKSSTKSGQSSQEQKLRIVLSPSALKTSSNTGKSSEEEVHVRLRAGSFSHRTSGLKTEHSCARTSSSLKTQGAKADSSRYFGSLMSLERCDTPTLAASKPELFRENSGATSGGNGRSNRSVPRLGDPASTSTSAFPSQVPAGVFAATSKLWQVRSGSGSGAAASGGLKLRMLSASNSKSPSSSPKPPENVAGCNTNLPSNGKSPSRSGTGAKTGKGTNMGTKQAIGRAANSRISELVSGSQRRMFGGGGGVTGSAIPGSRTGSITRSPLNAPLPSPYSKITAPRRPQRCSSGHGSDNSSILSGELPPAMGRTALFYHSGGSSGYESMIRDSETTGSTSSAHDSMSESGASSSNRSRVSKSPKKRGNGFLRRRLIPAPLPDTSSLGRKVGSQWVDLPPLGGTLKEQFEIKVYEIDDVECVQRRKEGLLYFNAQLRMLEKRQQQIQELKSKHDRLKAELEEVKSWLMLHPSRWSGEFDMDQDLDCESQEYLEALAQATGELEYCVNLCKSRLMMETCFDITGSRRNKRKRWHTFCFFLTSSL